MVDFQNCTLMRSLDPSLRVLEFVGAKSACAVFERGVMPWPVLANG